MRKKMIITILMMLVSLVACSKWAKVGDEEKAYKGMKAALIYASAKKSMLEEEYSTAIKRFEALEALYPFSDYSQRAERNLIFCYYKNDEMAAASSTADRYLHLYPSSKDVDYALYMKGLANFNQDRGSFAKVLPMDITYRDPGSQKQAYRDFSNLIHQYPNSRYVADANQRLIYLRNNSAQKELNVAEFYMTRKLYVAAANRASYVVKTYPQAPQTEQALIIMVKANRALGLQDSANEALKVLRATYPHSEALSKLSQS